MSRDILKKELITTDRLTLKPFSIGDRDRLVEMLKNPEITATFMVPDFSDESFGTQSGIAMKMKLLGMENKAQAIENTMRKALQKRFELITSILSLYVS